MEALLYTLGAFALILVLARLKTPLSLAIFLGAVAAGALFRLGPGELATTVGRGLILPRTVGLIAITAALLGLSGTMQAGGQMDRIVSLSRAMLRRPAAAMIALPALIGLLPMPGGALFSAPMVASAAGKATVSPARLSAINYWYRHIWEHWWPLYPGVILAVALTGSDFGAFAAFQFPLGVSMAASGLLILRGTKADLHAVGPRPPRGTRRKLVRATAPIWIIVLVWLVVAAALQFLPAGVADGSAGDALKLAPITLGILVSLVYTSRSAGLRRAALRKIWTDKRICNMVLLVASVMVFQHVLATVEAAGRIGGELTALHVPPALVVVTLPFIAGMVTGLAVGFVGTSFPIVIALVARMDGGESLWPYIALAYAFGHLGQMMSPLHLCHVMSNKYFSTPFGPVYRRVVPPALLTGALAATYFAVLNWVMN